MARPRGIPKISHHKASGRAVVRLDGHDHYLGAYGSTEALAAYHRTIAEWLANGRAPAAEGGRCETVAELAAAYATFAAGRFGGRGEIHNIRPALRVLVRLYADEPVATFGPRRLKVARAEMVRSGLARATVNARVRIL